MKKNSVKLSLCIMLACCMAAGLSGCSDKQGGYQETVAIANRYFNRLEYDKAEEYYLKSIEILPAQQEPYVNLYQIYMETERPQQAEQILVQARENLSAESFEQVEVKVQEIQKTAQTQASKSDEAMLVAYQQALRNLLNNHRLPDGEQLNFNSEYADPSEFAIADVNENGIPDLLVKYDGGAMVNLLGYIGEYDPESGSVQTIYLGGYSFEPYTRGFLQVDASHNHSYVTEVWPFDLYSWDENTDQFERRFSASGVKANGNDPYHPNPGVADTDGDGILFALTEHNGNQSSGSTTYFDMEEFEAKVADYTGNVERIHVEYLELNNENIDSLLAKEEEVTPENPGTETAVDFEYVSWPYLFYVSSDRNHTLNMSVDDNGKVVLEYKEYSASNPDADPMTMSFEGQLSDLKRLEGPYYRAVIDNLVKTGGQSVQTNSQEHQIMNHFEETLNGTHIYFYPVGYKMSNIPDRHIEAINKLYYLYGNITDNDGSIRTSVVVLDQGQLAFFAD